MRESLTPDHFASIVLDACQEGILFLDTYGRIRICNASAGRILGVDESGLLGLGAVDSECFAAVDEDFHPIPADRHPSRVALRTGNPCLDVVQGLPKGEGRYLWVKINAIPVRRPEGGRVEGVVVSFSDISGLKRMESCLRQEAYHDELTSLPNRRHFLQALTRAVNGAKRYGHPLSLCVCDLDRFKSVNDTYGHAAGDRAIRRFGDCLVAGLRQSDLGARLGGDEFCILFSHSHAKEAAVFVERIRALLGESPLSVNGHGFLALSASFGIASFDPAMDTESFLKEADQLLYQAKAEGGDRVRVL